MGTSARAPRWQILAAIAVAVGSIAVPVALEMSPLRAGAIATAAIVLTYGMRGRDRPRRDLLMGMTLVVLVGPLLAVQGEPLLGLSWCGVVPLGYLLRREREARRDPAMLDRTWTGWRARLAVALLVAGMLGSLVYVAATVRSWNDLISAAGPAAAVAIAGLLGSLIVLGKRLWLRRATRRWYAAARSRVEPALAELRREQAIAREERETGADDASLVAAADHAGMALLFLDSGPRLEAVHEIAELAAVASRDGWNRAAPLTRAIRRMERLGRRGARLRHGVDVEIDRPSPDVR
ncbi:hypothetical protein JL108_16995 [Aeromicrobium sp. YIM 150415]|uniref:hypothetical protein n=1 Tax=Aeromicrobium sp. YIM 150415 TaxID=2803912 RepID=UPI0019645F58|nr:hypothetical protein [Aeromicrobium sp. YIM 150415]MBM9465148.1 hypothetical protein [Aeromicrobium sp. YIM 150415]